MKICKQTSLLFAIFCGALSLARFVASSPVPDLSLVQNGMKVENAWKYKASFSKPEPPKDVYILLKSLRSVEGPDGRSPVCSICETQFVDANTYDYFCLPESEGMNGGLCDRLTVLGTTTSHNINAGCKLLRLRRPWICK